MPYGDDVMTFNDMEGVRMSYEYIGVKRNPKYDTKDQNEEKKSDVPETILLVRYEIDSNFCEGRKSNDNNASKCDIKSSKLKDFLSHDFTIRKANFILPCWWKFVLDSTSKSSFRKPTKLTVRKDDVAEVRS